MRLLFTGGGSGGHVYPAIALIKKLRQMDSNLELLYIGKQDSYEERICKRENIPFKHIQVRYLYRKKIYKNILTLIDFIKASNQVKTILADYKPDVVIGTGGYVSAPVIYTSAKKGYKTIIHEQNSIPGLTNKLLARYADQVAISFEESRPFFKHATTVLTGNPRAHEVTEVKDVSKKSLGLSDDKKFLLIFFGSQGAKYVNQKVADVLPLIDQLDDLETIFVTGKNHYDAIKKQINIEALQHTQVKDYLDDMPNYLSVCDLVISRAGATTISELTALGIPAIYIPSPYVTNNHQEKNALILVNHRAGVMIKEKELSHDGLLASIKKIIDNDTLLEIMGKHNLELANREGIEAFVNMIYS